MSHYPSRRALLQGAAALAVAAAAPLPRAFAADPWPTRPVKIIVGYPAGGANDLVARSVAQAMTEKLGQTFIVDNKSGAAGAIAAEAAAKSPPDGYTLYAMSSAQVLAPSLRKTVPYDPVKDFTAIALAARGSYVLCVHPSQPMRSVKELIDYAKANPGKLNYASSGTGAGPHLASEVFASMADVKLTHVPYRGDTPAITDLLAGQVEMGFMSLAPILPHVKSGAVRALAVASGKRSAALPDVPTVAEAALPGYDIGVWWGLVAPAGTPAEIIAKVESVVVPYLKSPATAQRFLEMGLEPGEVWGEAFQREIAKDKKRYAEIVQRAGIEPE
jgi:tripartite-type tricarboxylate transporter receptor subunit TctC